MKKVFPVTLIVFGLILMGAGGYTTYRGVDAKDQVRRELVAQNITTPDDATIPGAPVRNAATARSMAEIINEHSLEATGGKTYAELDREDPARQTALTAANLRTSLYTTVMAFNLADLVIGLGALFIALGVAVAGIGVALAGLVIPRLARRLHVKPAAAGPAPLGV